MKKQQIAEKLHRWIADGKMLSKKMTGKRDYEVKIAVKRGELIMTKVVRLYATTKEVANEFNKLVDSKSVMTLTDVMLEYNALKTPYAVTAACARNEFLKFCEFSNIPLFIKGE